MPPKRKMMTWDALDDLEALVKSGTDTAEEIHEAHQDWNMKTIKNYIKKYREVADAGAGAGAEKKPRTRASKKDVEDMKAFADSGPYTLQQVVARFSKVSDNAITNYFKEINRSTRKATAAESEAARKAIEALSKTNNPATQRPYSDLNFQDMHPTVTIEKIRTHMAKVQFKRESKADAQPLRSPGSSILSSSSEHSPPPETGDRPASDIASPQDVQPDAPPPGRLDKLSDPNPTLTEEDALRVHASFAPGVSVDMDAVTHRFKTMNRHNNKVDPAQGQANIYFVTPDEMRALEQDSLPEPDSTSNFLAKRNEPLLVFPIEHETGHVSLILYNRKTGGAIHADSKRMTLGSSGLTFGVAHDEEAREKLRKIYAQDHGYPGRDASSKFTLRADPFPQQTDESDNLLHFLDTAWGLHARRNGVTGVSDPLTRDELREDLASHHPSVFPTDRAARPPSAVSSVRRRFEETGLEDDPERVDPRSKRPRGRAHGENLGEPQKGSPATASGENIYYEHGSGVTERKGHLYDLMVFNDAEPDSITWNRSYKNMVALLSHPRQNWQAFSDMLEDLKEEDNEVYRQALRTKLPKELKTMWDSFEANLPALKQAHQSASNVPVSAGPYLPGAAPVALMYSMPEYLRPTLSQEGFDANAPAFFADPNIGMNPAMNPPAPLGEAWGASALQAGLPRAAAPTAPMFPRHASENLQSTPYLGVSDANAPALPADFNIGIYPPAQGEAAWGTPELQGAPTHAWGAAPTTPMIATDASVNVQAFGGELQPPLAQLPGEAGRPMPKDLELLDNGARIRIKNSRKEMEASVIAAGAGGYNRANEPGLHIEWEPQQARFSLKDRKNRDLCNLQNVPITLNSDFLRGYLHAMPDTQAQEEPTGLDSTPQQTMQRAAQPSAFGPTTSRSGLADTLGAPAFPGHVPGYLRSTETSEQPPATPRRRQSERLRGKPSPGQDSGRQGTGRGTGPGLGR